MRSSIGVALLGMVLACCGPEPELYPAFAKLDCPGTGTPKGGNGYLYCRDRREGMEGPYVKWDTTTKALVATGTNSRGTEHGIRTEYYPNGNRHNEGAYVYGVKDGPHTTWSEDGTLLLTQFYDAKQDGKLLRSEYPPEYYAKYGLEPEAPTHSDAGSAPQDAGAAGAVPKALVRDE